MWHSLSRAPIRNFLWCYYRWLITFLALEKCRKRTRYCLNYSGTIKVFVHWKLKLLNFLISCFHMTSRRPCLCTKTNLWELNSFRMLGSVQTQQLPTLLRQQCWKLLRACWQWCANGCNNSQQCWYLGRIQPISLCKPCVMSVRGPNIVGRVGSCWLKSLTGFKLCATTLNNIQQHPTGCANGRNM